jgi:hypothetical protein
VQRTVFTDPYVLGCALRDVINTFTREVIVGRKLIGDEQMDILDSDEVRKEINVIIEYFVEKWKSCVIDDAAG